MENYNKIDKLIIPRLQNMQPYSPIYPPDIIAEKYGLSENDIVKFPINLDPAYNYTFFAYSINKYGVSNISNSKTWPQ